MTRATDEFDTEVTCNVCKVAHIIRVPRAGYMSWLKGARIQDVMPNISADDRELLISGMCGKCFDKLFED